MIRFIALAAIIATLGAGAATAADRSTSPTVGDTEKATPPPNNTKGSSGDDKNTNPDAAVKRGEIDESSVQSLLQSKGYVDIRALTRDDDVFTATAHKDNQLVRVHVDARDGTVTDLKLQ